MSQQTRQRGDINQPSYLNIIMYSDEHGETTVEGDEEEEQLANGVYEQYYDDAVFEIDDFPARHQTRSSSPDMQVRYYVPTSEAPHGLSQSVDVNESPYFMRSVILSTKNNNWQESNPTTTLDKQASSSHQPSFSHTVTDDTAYSQSAPATSFLSSHFQKCSTESPKTVYRNDSMREECVNQTTISETNSLHDKFLQEDNTVTITKSPVQANESLFTKENSVGSPIEQSNASSPISSRTETENNLQMVTTSTVLVEDSLDDWDSLSAAHFNTRNALTLCQRNIKRSHDERKKDVRSVEFAANLMTYAVPMRVVGISSHTRHKDLQNHFFDSNVLFIRYVSRLHCAYITYINHEEMIKAVRKFNGSVLRDTVIYCRPSLFEELERDNELNSKLLYRLSQQPATKKQFLKRSSFIPEHNSISQYNTKDISKRYTTSLTQYHPQCVSGYDYHQGFGGRCPYYAFKIIPIIRLLATSSYSPSHYVINSYEVNLIFSVKGTKAYQGYAIMKSEVLDLKLLTDEDTAGTIFQEVGSQFRIRPNGRPWRYVFRVEWKST
ncbi:hypothetical protein INT48_006751 [Thamnidium elegans]|uniref:YTH domain-containing protein n=1 Tax=Thamnidium elegans TaxID=101142 RepID=A0A8H7W1A9_9FUNG|nr:hypothetical protein INT48_006751 [Thamnidium elegans]